MGTPSEPEDNEEESYAFEVKEEPDPRDENIGCVTIATTSTTSAIAPVTAHASAIAPIAARASVTSPASSTCRRKILWTPEEETRLVGAWLHNSTDPVHRVARKTEKYWSAVYNEFHANDPAPGNGPQRSKKQMKDHWQRWNQTVTRFNKIYLRCARKLSNSQSDEQIMEAAEKMYLHECHAHFNKKHWWKLVKDETKWRTLADLIQQNQGSQSQGSRIKRTRLDETGSCTLAMTSPSPPAPTSTSSPSAVPSIDHQEIRQQCQKTPENKGQGGTSDERASTAHVLYEVERMKLESSRVRARETYFKRLEELEEKDTSNMTSTQLERHNKKIKILWDLFESGNS